MAGRCSFTKQFDKVPHKRLAAKSERVGVLELLRHLRGHPFNGDTLGLHFWNPLSKDEVCAPTIVSFKNQNVIWATL